MRGRIKGDGTRARARVRTQPCTQRQHSPRATRPFRVDWPRSRRAAGARTWRRGVSDLALFSTRTIVRAGSLRRCTHGGRPACPGGSSSWEGGGLAAASSLAAASAPQSGSRKAPPAPAPDPPSALRAAPITSSPPLRAMRARTRLLSSCSPPASATLQSTPHASLSASGARALRIRWLALSLAGWLHWLPLSFNLGLVRARGDRQAELDR